MLLRETAKQTEKFE